MAKVLLIQPHVNRMLLEKDDNIPTPLNLIHVGTAIEDKHPVKIFDRNININDEYFLKFIREFNPDIVGMNSITSGMLYDLMHLGKLIKKEMPEKIIVIGGVHATIEPDSVLEEDYVDYIIRGEGEEAFMEFCNTFDKDPKKLRELRSVNHNPLRPFVKMDDLKLPNYGLVDLKKYGTVYVNLSRGCPGDCSFCYSPRMWGINNKPHIRAYSTKKAIEFFKELMDKYKVRNFSFVDDNFIPFKSRAIEICKFLEKYDVNFFCFGRADYINDEILQALRKAGCHTIQIGLESGNQRVLDFLNKRLKVEDNIRSVQCCKRNKVICDGSMMIGITTETEDELNDTVNFIKKYRPDLVNVKIFNPMPGTRTFDYCIEKGLFEKPKNLKEWAAWTSNMTELSHNTSGISSDKLIKTVQELWMVGYYSNKIKRLLYWLKKREFKYILKNLKKAYEIRGGMIRIPGLGFIKSRPLEVQ